MNRRALLLLLAFIVLVVGVALLIGLRGGKPAADNCHAEAPAASYRITIENDKASATTIHGHLCDTLTYTNKDKAAREIAFGRHDDHVPYDGVAERVLTQNESFTITFDKTGTYRWHDHLHDEVTGSFTVTQ